MGFLKKLFSKSGLSAQQIKLENLEDIIQQLTDNKLEYEFFGITSDGNDCIYFVNNNGKINIEFEVMAIEQKYFVDKLKRFALDNKYNLSETTHGTKPIYNDVMNAPVYRLEINADKESAAKIGKQIMISVFSRDETTVFDVVP